MTHYVGDSITFLDRILVYMWESGFSCWILVLHYFGDKPTQQLAHWASHNIVLPTCRRTAFIFTDLKVST